MTEREFIKNFIEVTEHERQDGTVVQATVKCGAGSFVPSYLTPAQRNDALKHAREHCVEQVLRLLYKDRRSEFADALFDYLKDCRPNYLSSHDSEVRLFECVKRMAPAWADKRLGKRAGVSGI